MQLARFRGAVETSLVAMLILLSGGCQESLPEAVLDDDLHSVKKLLAGGANPNAIVDVAEEESVLFRAVKNDRVDIAAALLESGADPNFENLRTQTPLFDAKSAEMVSLLIRHGANSRVFDEAGLSALHSVAKFGVPEALEIMVKHGARVDDRGPVETTPLHLAACGRGVENVRVLLKLGAPVNARSTLGNTPLHLAAAAGNLDACRVLLEHGADLTVKNKYGFLAKDLAREWGHPGVAEFLTKAGS